MFNDEKEFNRAIKIIKIKNLDERFYSEFDYIKDVENWVNTIINRKRFLKNIFHKKFDIYKTGLNNRKKIEIDTIIKDSKMYKLIEYMNHHRKVDLFNIEIILQEKNFLLYALENGYIEKNKLENIKEYLIDLDFNKDYPEYNVLIKTQNSLKYKIDDILGI